MPDVIDIPDAHNPRWLLEQTGAEAAEPFTGEIVASDSIVLGTHAFNEQDWMALELGPPVSRDVFAESKSWINWTPSPLEIRGRRTGEPLLTISEKRLTAVRYLDPPHKKGYVRLTVNWTTHAWQCTKVTDTRPYERRLQILESGGGSVVEFDYWDRLWCNRAYPKTWTWDINYDLWELLHSARSVGLGEDLWRRC